MTGMVTFLIFVVIGLLIYIICELTDSKKTKPETSYKEVIPQFLNKYCEITIKNSLASIDVMYSTRGVLTDMDDEWIMLERTEKSKRSVKVLRIDNIGGIKEISNLSASPQSY